MKNHLSDRQTRMLCYVRDYISRKGYPPSVRDIQRQCDISSTSVVDYNLKRLTEKGYIEREFSPDNAAPSGMTLDAPVSIVDGHGTARAWEIRADSMPDALAAEGDLLLVQEDSNPQDGDTIVAWVESRGETVIRRRYLEGPTVRLEALNPSHKALNVLASDVSVTGKVVGLLRSY